MDPYKDIYSEKLIESESLTFDDVLIVPNYSQYKRDEIDLSCSFSDKLKLGIPVISSPMDTVTEKEMAVTLGKLGGLGVIHRNMTVDKQIKIVGEVKKNRVTTAAAVGVGSDFKERSAALVKAGVEIILLDSAHGFSKWVIEATQYLRKNFKNIFVISGNVATSAGAKTLIDAGAQSLRVGMGPGSICTTRIVSGMGVGQISAIIETASVAKKFNIPVIADGGIRFAGDIAKAISAGASFVMLGSILAGCKQAPGKVVSRNGKKYKEYRGMGSVSAMKEGSAARYGQNFRVGQEKSLVAEGVEGLVEYKGELEDVLAQLTGGLRTGMYYAGVRNIEELRRKSRLVRISGSSLIESHPHDIIFK